MGLDRAFVCRLQPIDETGGEGTQAGRHFGGRGVPHGCAKDNEDRWVAVRAGELPHAFQGLRVLRYEEPIAKPDFAPKPARVVRFAAEKPAE